MEVFVIQSISEVKKDNYYRVSFIYLKYKCIILKSYELSKQIQFSKIKKKSAFLISYFLIYYQSIHNHRSSDKFPDEFYPRKFPLQHVDVVEKHIYNINLKDNKVSLAVCREYFLTGRVFEENTTRNLSVKLL